MNNPLQISIAGILVFLLLTLADLVPFWMPTMGTMVALTLVSVLLLLWAGFVLFEKNGDERELVHRMNAGRVAYLSGLGFLTVALVVQGFAHDIDPWVACALGVMVVSKLVARTYAEKYL